MNRILIVGCHGLLGQKLVETFSRQSGYTLKLISIEERSFFKDASLDYTQIDITSRTAVKNIIEQFHPDVILNAAAYTDVDGCEKERELAWRVNVGGVENLIAAARGSSTKIVHISSDYIFDGTSGPYSEEDIPNPLSYYGKTKLASENALRGGDVPYTILRTMILYGVARNVRANFVLWVASSLRDGKRITVVDDQIGNPTLADDLAYAMLKVVELDKTGVYNVSGPDLINRHEFALKIAQVYGGDEKLIFPIKTADLHQPAPRPLRSGFVTLKASTELGITTSGVVQGLHLMKRQIRLYAAFGPHE